MYSFSFMIISLSYIVFNSPSDPVTLIPSNLAKFLKSLSSEAKGWLYSNARKIILRSAKLNAGGSSAVSVCFVGFVIVIHSGILFCYTCEYSWKISWDIIASDTKICSFSKILSRTKALRTLVSRISIKI